MAKEAKLLIVVNGIFTLALGMSNIFVNIFIWKNTNSFITVAVYNLMHYFSIPAAFIAGGLLSKRKNGVWSLRLGICLFIIFFLLILLLKDNMVSHLYFLGILFGLATGFYWLAFFVLDFDFTCVTNRDTFNGYNGCITGVSNAAAPFISGFIIQKSGSGIGYTRVFMVSLVLFVLLIIISLFLKAKYCGECLDWKRSWSKNSCEWGNIRLAFAAWGLRDVIIVFLITILVFKATGSEWMVGKLSLYAALISSVSYVIEQRLIKPKKRLLSIKMDPVSRTL